MPVHFSNLKQFALSPAHYKQSIDAPFEPTRGMRIGTVVHHLVLGPSNIRPLIKFDGDSRRGKEWTSFKAAHPEKEIVTATEWEEAIPMAEAVLRDPVAAGLLKGARTEIPLEWDDAGIKCATRGVDVIGDGFLADLKTTTCTEPQAWTRHATKLLYHCQMSWYENGAKSNGIDVSRGLKLIGVESSAPYAVTVLNLGEAVRLQGRKSLTIWLERLRTCLENDFWPAYAQSEVEFELPAWMGDDEGGEDE